MRVTICGPNLRDQSKGDFHVHAAGCADLRRGAAREPEYRHGWTIDASSRESVAGEVYADIIAENPGSTAADYVETMHFFPCCGELPMNDDPLTPAARAVLDALGDRTGMTEWHPQLSGGATFVVVLPDERAVRITVEAVPDPGPVESD